MAAAPKILVIDDDRTFTTMAASLLHAAGYRTVVAFDAMQGFMFAGREAPALVLLDLSMPAGGGMQLLDKLRHSSKTQNVPVIIVTATAARGLEAEVKAKGAAAVVIKPVDPKALVELVKQVLEHHADDRQP
ncbi:MAG TPA: response regulator [Gemmatimonadales bacterium]|nr:response regulator [Gemmatimonadales bacterium]